MDQEPGRADAEALPVATVGERRGGRRRVRGEPLASDGTRALFLFGRDLRLADHAGLAAAARNGDVLPVLVLEPETLERYARNGRRAAYYCGAVASLARELGARGAELVVRRGPLARTVLRLARDARATSVTWSATYDAASIARRTALQSILEEAGVRATVVHDAPAVAPEETAFARTSDGGTGYRAFAPYLAVWSRQPREPHDMRRVSFAAGRIASEPLPDEREFGAVPHAETPSSERALAELDAYLASAVLAYPSARDVPAGDATSRLSAHLAFGTLSARTVLARVDERARDPFLLAEERLALRAFVRALAQRDFFYQLAWYFEAAPDAPLQRRMKGFPFASHHPALAAWRDGRTGYPFVDAGIRQLRTTGWMHPRARLVAASFLCFDLGVDWRVGRDAWEAELEEDDPALASGNWQWVAGVGADLAQFPRIYNPRRQARAFDPLGRYARRYIPELRDVSDADLFARGDGSPRAQLALPLFDATSYASPVVEHERAAREFLKRYAAYVRRTAATTP